MVSTEGKMKSLQEFAYTYFTDCIKDLHIFYSSTSVSLPGMKLTWAIVVLAAALPHSKVWRTVGTLNIEHKVLYKVHLVSGEDDLEKGKIFHPLSISI